MRFNCLVAMLKKFDLLCANSQQAANELEMPPLSKSFWFDRDFTNCLLFVCGNGVLFWFVLLALSRGDYRWIGEFLLEGGICTLGLSVYRTYRPIFLWLCRMLERAAPIS